MPSPGELERKEREHVEKSNEGQYLSKFFAMRAELSATTGFHNPFSNHHYSPVKFLRPDGDIEDLQWCLDNDFFQIHEGYNRDYPLWSGPWYYRDRPEERPMHLQKTKAIRRGNRTFTNLVDILIFRNKKTVMEEVFCRIVCMLSKYVDGANIVTIFSSQYFSFDI